jgi:hypothetical protein
MSIVPSRLYRVKIFESHEVFTPGEGGWFRDPDKSDDILEIQINDWISKEKVLVVGTGPINVIENKYKTWREATRTATIIYAPPVEQGDHTYGEQPQQKRRAGSQTPEPSKSGSQMSARGVSDGHLGG